MKKNFKKVMAWMLVLACMITSAASNVSAKVKETRETEVFFTNANNMIKAIYYDEVDRKVQLKAQFEVSKTSGYSTFDFYIVTADGTITHEDADRSPFTSDGDGYNYYIFQTLAEPGSKIKVGGYGYTEEKKNDETLISAAHEITVTEVTSADSVPSGKPTTTDPFCPTCGSKELREDSSTANQEMHTISYHIQGCKKIKHIMYVSEHFVHSRELRSMETGVM